MPRRSLSSQVQFVLNRLTAVAHAFDHLCQVSETHSSLAEVRKAAIPALDLAAESLPIFARCREVYGCFPATRDRLENLEVWATLKTAEKAEQFDEFTLDITSKPVHDGLLNEHSWGEQLVLWVETLERQALVETHLAAHVSSATARKGNLDRFDRESIKRALLDAKADLASGGQGTGGGKGAGKPGKSAAILASVAPQLRRKRKKRPGNVDGEALTSCRRRCCLCFGLKRDASEKPGQIAHLDGDPSNNDKGNLAYLCLEHHDKYDTRTSQSKGLTIEEVRHYRDALYRYLKTHLSD